MTVSVRKTITKKLIESLLAGYKKSENLIVENGLLKQLSKLSVECALDAERSEHLGHHKNAPNGNAGNSKSEKTLKAEFGELPIQTPRDRQGSFELQLIPKYQTRCASFEDEILLLDARHDGMQDPCYLEERCDQRFRPLCSPVLDFSRCGRQTRTSN